ncbi:MAG: hypothetical protein C4523_02650 [Myxococcales bacterium]|nr:MAG: hypothetical protein C4523_02650 [Myxococcales bacterium]
MVVFYADDHLGLRILDVHRINGGVVMTFDITKCREDENGHLIARTRDGRRVRILCTDAASSEPIVGLVLGDREESAESWHLNGLWHPHGSYPDWDLVNEPATHTVTVFLFRNGVVTTVDVAYGDVNPRELRGHDARKVITITEGEGL